MFCIDLNTSSTIHSTRHQAGFYYTGVIHGGEVELIWGKNRHYIAIFSYWLSLIFTDIVKLCMPIHKRFFKQKVNVGCITEAFIFPKCYCIHILHAYLWLTLYQGEIKIMYNYIFKRLLNNIAWLMLAIWWYFGSCLEYSQSYCTWYLAYT